MKAPLVALAATAAGFAAASAYLYGELGVERVRTQAEVAARSKHEARFKQMQTSGAESQASVLPFSQIESSSFVDSQTPPPKLSIDGLVSLPPSNGSPASLGSANPDPNAPNERSVPAHSRVASQTVLTSDGKLPAGQTASAVFTRDDRDSAPRVARRLMRERSLSDADSR